MARVHDAKWAAAELGVSIRTFRHMVKNGHIKYTRLPAFSKKGADNSKARYGFTEAHINEYLKSHEILDTDYRKHRKAG